MQFYRFSSGGSPVDALVGMLFGSIPAMVIVLLTTRESSAAGFVMGVLLVIYAALFYFSLSRGARVLERNWEQLRGSLS
jgi:hypothetical protein